MRAKSPNKPTSLLAFSLLALLIAAVACSAWADNQAHASTVRHVLFDLAHGRAGGLRLGHSTQRSAVRRYGQPRQVSRDGITGSRRLVWSCGKGCELEVRVRGRRRRVVTVWAYGEVNRPRIRTTAGSHLGTGERAAARLEGGTFVDSCTRELHKVRGRLTESLSVSNGRVSSIMIFSELGGVAC
jgi:hypothetical protein